MPTTSPSDPLMTAVPSGSVRPARPRSPLLARAAALGGLALVALVVLYLVASRGQGTDYKVLFDDAGQLVRGDQVQVGGQPVGSIKDIVLTSDNKALVKVHIDSSLAPLHEGTTAEIRVPSLSGVANRFIALAPGPNNRPALVSGATIPTSATRGTVDLDQLFNVFDPKTRKGLEQVIEGSAEQYAGAEAAVNTGTRYFNPSLTATTHVFDELTHDQQTFTSFLVNASQALGVLAARRGQLASLIGNADTTFQAVGSQHDNLAQGLRELPKVLHQGNKTFADLGPTLSAVRQLVDVSKPNTKTLALFLREFHSLLVQGTPTVADLSAAIDQPGSSNDLTDLALALPGLAKALSSSTPDTVKALEESVPVTAFFGPYSPDLEGLLRDFGQGTAYYDANGHYTRVSPVFGDFRLGSDNVLRPVSPQQGIEGLKTGQLRRCPGGATAPAADGSSPFSDNGLLSCDPTQTP
jgi:phospholipid/cholesterol/gamma-HCH transport system substrate-binding protein